MPLAEIGLITMVMEASATAIGAGVLLGGFLAGSVGSVRGWPRRLLDRRVLVFGYAGGAVGVLALLVDLVVRYAD